MHVLEDFAGPGGWDEGARLAGSTAVIIGREINDDAIATAEAAGHKRIKCDVLRAKPHAHVDGYIASPPCQTFSTAGKGEGRKHLASLVKAAQLVADGMHPTLAVGAVADEVLDERSVLVLHPLRVIRESDPDWVAMEQVPNALPVFEAIAEIMRERFGYRVRTEVLYAEEFGVPQTRKRAILVAIKEHLADEVPWPTKTHSKYHVRTPEKIDEGYQRWVSMAEALTWANTDLVGFPRRYDGRGEVVLIDGVEYRGRDLRPASEPAQTVTEKARSWARYMGDVAQSNGTVRSVDQPSPTITGAMDNGNFRWLPENADERYAQVRKWLFRNGNQANSAVRSEDQPAPTIHFGGRCNAVDWLPDNARPGQEDATDWTYSGAGGGAQERIGQRPRELDEPGHTVTGKGTGLWIPEFNDQSGTPYDPEWPSKRPATVVAGRGLVQNPGATANRMNGSTKSRNDGVRVSVAEAGVLQSFPVDYPWQGTKTSQYQRVGDAVPPLLGAAVLQPILALFGALDLKIAA